MVSEIVVGVNFSYCLRISEEYPHPGIHKWPGWVVIATYWFQLMVPNAAKAWCFPQVQYPEIIDHCYRESRTDHAPIHMLSARRGEPTACHQELIRHGGVFTRCCFADLQLSH